MKPSNLINKLGKESATDSNKILENIRKLGGNKSCFDCGEKGVTYIVPKFGTFVCSRCSGIHRELGNMVKGLGVSNFTDKEISFLQEMGNDNANLIWMAKFNPEKHKKPNPTDDNAIKEHIKIKYQNKKWYKAQGSKDEDEQEDNSKKKKKKESDDEDEVDIKPTSLKKSNKNIVHVKEEPKKSNSNVGNNVINTQKAPIQEQPKLKKLNIGNSGNKNQEWNPQFRPSVNSNQMKDPFDSSNNHDDGFDFGDSNTQQAPQNPFNWGSSSTSNTTPNVQSNPLNQQSQGNKESNQHQQSNILDNIFDFAQPNTQTTQPIGNQSSINNINITNIHVVDTKQTKENPPQQQKKTYDDLINMLNKTNINDQNQHHQQSFGMNPMQPFGTYPNYNQQFNPQQFNPQMIMQNPQMMMMLQQMMMNQGNFNQFPQMQMNQGINQIPNQQQTNNDIFNTFPSFDSQPVDQRKQSEEPKRQNVSKVYYILIE